MNNWLKGWTRDSVDEQWIKLINNGFIGWSMNSVYEHFNGFSGWMEDSADEQWIGRYIGWTMN